MHKSAFEEYLCEAGSYLGNGRRDSSRLMDKGELLQERGQMHWISQRNSPGNGELSWSHHHVANKANSKIVVPKSVFRKRRQPYDFISWYTI